MEPGAIRKTNPAIDQVCCRYGCGHRKWRISTARILRLAEELDSAGYAALEVTGGGSDKDRSGKNTLDFVVDKNTQVKGQVKQGTPVTVEYQAMENGQLLAVSIMAQA